MEVAQLRALVTIVEAGSFTGAAERLHVSQPALSQQIKALERDLGAPLFVRQGRRNTLTAVGEVALARAQGVLSQLDQLTHEVGALMTMTQGQIRIGTSDTICLYLLPPIVQAFRHAHPQIEIHLTNRPSQEVVTLLQTGAIDFGIVTLPVQSVGIETTYLCARQDVAVCAPEHLLAQTDSATLTCSLETLCRHSLLLLEQGTTSRAFLDQRFLQADITPTAMDLGSIEVLKRYAEINLGVAIVPEMAVQAEVADGRLRHFILPWMPERAIGMVIRRDAFHLPATTAFIELLQSHYEHENAEA